MRAVFHGELERLGVELAIMCGLAAEAMDKATRALLSSDLAQRVRGSRLTAATPVLSPPHSEVRRPSDTTAPGRHPG